MSLDTRYRPTRYSDVIGQESTTHVLRQIVKSGAGFHQSYVFCGDHGSGKTTQARILARALLCDSPVDGEPCDQCDSCKMILERGGSDAFVEIDAATNSGKDEIKQVISDLQYSTFSGKRRIYLYDEAHELSKQALDALLKSMEDTVPGTQDKLLICIFCTTEPEKMRATIFSRCAPAFKIKKVTPEILAGRLQYVCEREGIDYDPEALVLISEVVECHVRDALKALESVSTLGKITRDTVTERLRLTATTVYLRILGALGRDLGVVLRDAELLKETGSPAVCYGALAEMAMLAFRSLHHGAGSIPSYVDEALLNDVAQHHKDFLLVIADHLASRPAKPSHSMLLCDLSVLHNQRAGTALIPDRKPLLAATSPATSPIATGEVSSPGAHSNQASTQPGKVGSDPASQAATPPVGTEPETLSVRLDRSSLAPSSNGTLAPLDVDLFRAVLRRRVAELQAGQERGSTGRSNLGGY